MRIPISNTMPSFQYPSPLSRMRGNATFAQETPLQFGAENPGENPKRAKMSPIRKALLAGAALGAGLGCANIIWLLSLPSDRNSMSQLQLAEFIHGWNTISTMAEIQVNHHREEIKAKCASQYDQPDQSERCEEEEKDKLYHQWFNEYARQYEEYEESNKWYNKLLAMVKGK